MTIEAFQPQVYNQVKRILASGKLGHAYLLSGRFGARALTQYLTQARLCDSPTTDRQPCGSCRSCQLVTQGNHPDVHEVVAQGELIKTEAIRELIQYFYQSAIEGQYQVIVIDGAEKLHPTAANSLLKVIEEPEGKVQVILLTGNSQAVLATIRSRVQTFVLAKQEAPLLARFEQQGVLKQDARLLSNLAEDLADVDHLLTDKFFLACLDSLKRFARLLGQGEAAQAFLLAATISKSLTEKKHQAQALDVVLYSLIQDKQVDLAQKAIKAANMRRANVSFQSCLEYIVIGE